MDAEALYLRDLLKFEFFFKEKDAFSCRLRGRAETTIAGLAARRWRGDVSRRWRLLKAFRPLTAHGVLRSFFRPTRLSPTRWPHAIRGIVDERKLLNDCGAVGRQYMLQHQIKSAGRVSKRLFQTGLQLIRHQKLLEATDNVAGWRKVFAASLADIMRRIDTVEALAQERMRENALAPTCPSWPARARP